MTQETKYAITISRQLGSGGAFLGQRLAEKLNFLYLDRDIIGKTANELGLSARNLEWRDEKILSKWQLMAQSMSYTAPEAYMTSQMYIPPDIEIFKTESDVISRLAKENSVVVIGRCGSKILANHPKHLSLYLHADIEFRIKRVQELYKISYKAAQDYINSVDKSRRNYVHTITGRDMNDARQYHLSINTGVIGFDEAENLIIHAFSKLDDLSKKGR